MKVNEYETKFSVEDVVWFMYHDRPAQGIVREVCYEQKETANFSYNDIYINIFKRIKSYIERHKEEISISYSVDRVKDDGRFDGCMFLMTEDKLFHTKEELLESL